MPDYAQLCLDSAWPCMAGTLYHETAAAIEQGTTQVLRFPAPRLRALRDCCALAAREQMLRKAGAYTRPLFSST